MTNAQGLRLRINGEEREVPGPTTVEGLLRHLEIDTRQVAVERNRVIVSKTEYGSTDLADDDELEIVTFVGGG